MASPTIVFVLLVITAAFLFYGLIPGIGAFSVRARWRRFRKRIIEVSLYPFVRYADLAGESDDLGKYRIFASLEAIQGQNRIWINSGSFSVEVDLKGVKIYVLPSYASGKQLIEKLQENLAEQQAQSIPWKRIHSLPAGTKMFVGGRLFAEKGRKVFRSLPKEPLIVVIYDGDRESILLRAIWGGRQKNEYWNQFTLSSLIVGSISLLLIAYVFLRYPTLRLTALTTLTLAFFPIVALLPPGVALNYPYRYFWKQARRLRAERDLLLLPMRYFSSSADYEKQVSLPDGETYLMTRDLSVLIQDHLTIRGSSVLGPSASSDYVLFGAFRGGTEKTLKLPQDPMAELLMVLGDPQVLSRLCNSRARLFELLSAVFVFSGIGLNLFLILLFWHTIIR